ncbi:uncharacterized protein [Rutidosis leptorrhynchoides]|uniref:uncharacterized protein n=1 Tax=Rutidosis leptorrhynchoides TaxID=125765 RepID=UPI003A9A0BB2
MMKTPSPLAPFLVHTFILPSFIYTHKSLIRKFKLFQIIRYTITTVFLFLLKIIPPSLKPNSNKSNDSSNNYSDTNLNNDGCDQYYYPYVKFFKENNNKDDGTDTCIARALTQLLAIVNEIPVSSRKYEVVRSYAEKLMDENLVEGNESLRKVNATVLSCAFSRTLGQLELAVMAAGVAAEDDGSVVVNSDGGVCFGLNRVVKTVGRYGDVAWTRFRKRRLNRFGGSGEKLAAELLWLAEKLAACGSGGEAVCQWASASKLASVALSAQLRLQGSLVKICAYLLKQAAGMGGEDAEEGNGEELREVKMKLLMSWLPFLCRASIGTDAPVLTFNEKIELENVLGELISSLKHEEEQEKILSLWIDHFTRCASSDWPNLQLYYTRWCTTSRKLLILEGR